MSDTNQLLQANNDLLRADAKRFEAIIEEKEIRLEVCNDHVATLKLLVKTQENEISALRQQSQLKDDQISRLQEALQRPGVYVMEQPKHDLRQFLVPFLDPYPPPSRALPVQCESSTRDTVELSAASALLQSIPEVSSLVSDVFSRSLHVQHIMQAQIERYQQEAAAAISGTDDVLARSQRTQQIRREKRERQERERATEAVLQAQQSLISSISPSALHILRLLGFPIPSEDVKAPIPLLQPKVTPTVIGVRESTLRMMRSLGLPIRGEVQSEDVTASATVLQSASSALAQPAIKIASVSSGSK